MATKPETATTSRSSKPNAHVLVADDDPNVTKTLAAILEREHHDVAVATNLRQAKRLAEREKFDAAIVDLRLDTEDGIELVKLLREVQGGFCSVIVLTGYGSLESAQEAIRAEAYDYLTKPCTPDELKAAVARAVERSSLVRQLEDKIEELARAQAQIKQLADKRERELNQAVADRTAQLAKANQELQDAYLSQEHYVEELEQSRATILQLSAPALPIQEKVLLFPLIGTLDDARIRHLGDELLESVRLQRAEVVVLDCTGLVEMNPAFAEQTSKLASAARLLGASIIITGLSAESCDTLVRHGVIANGFTTAGDLRHGIEMAAAMIRH